MLRANEHAALEAAESSLQTPWRAYISIQRKRRK
jgi:hypothetical protein